MMDVKNLPNEFQMMDVEKICELKRTRLQTWMERGWIVPSIQKATGHGTRNIWNRQDLYNIAIFKKITESGWSREVAGDFLVSGVLFFHERVDDIKFIVYMRHENSVRAAALTYNEGDDIKIDIEHLQDNLDMKEFDDMYVINFVKLRTYIDEKIKKIKR